MSTNYAKYNFCAPNMCFGKEGNDSYLMVRRSAAMSKQD